jgi:hypothetical protein
VNDLRPAFVTTRQAGPATASAPAECPIAPSDAEFGLTGLKAASVVRLDKLATLHRRLVPRRLGRLGPQTTGAFAQELCYIFHL